MEIINTSRLSERFSLRYIDKTFWVLFAILIGAALIALFSATSTLVFKSNSNFGPVGHQLVFILLGVGVAWVVQFMPNWAIRLMGYVLLGVCILCLYLMIIPGSPFVKEINGAGRWFRLAGVQFQPSEFAKVALVVVVADMLARIKDAETMRRQFFRTLIVSGVTILPIMLGNLSTAILMAAIVFLMWILARIDWRYLLATVSIALVVLIGGYFLASAVIHSGHTLPKAFKRASVWVMRVDDLIAEKKAENSGEEFVLTDANYQRSLAKVAVARGGVAPWGVLPGNSKERDFLPLAYADYIFAIIVEETGIMGAIALIFLYMAILFRACFASSRFDDHSAMLMVMGLALMITCQAMISMAVAVGVGPVTGQPLPLITLGGSSSLATALYFGIMMAVSREQNELKGHQDDIREESLNDVPNLEVD